MTVGVVAVVLVVVFVRLALGMSTISSSGVDKTLELATVKEDAATLLALIDLNAVALLAAHFTSAFRTDEARCVSHLVPL